MIAIFALQRDCPQQTVQARANLTGGTQGRSVRLGVHRLVCGQRLARKTA